ncbi:hypothetical protein HK096_005238, partial [Nowakowskiella sp. JEL0078]
MSALFGITQTVSGVLQMLEKSKAKDYADRTDWALVLFNFCSNYSRTKFLLISSFQDGFIFMVNY